MSGQDYEQQTLFREDSPVNHSVWPGSAAARTMTVTSGLKCLELSANSGPLGLLEKMLLESSAWRSTRCFLTWKIKDTRQGHLLFRLVPSMPRTGGIVSQSWPAPTAADVYTWKLKSSQQKPGSMHSVTLPDAVKMWPTATASDWRCCGPNSHQQGLPEEVRLWPTPRANKVGGYSSPDFSPTLEQAVKEETARMWPTPSSCKAQHGYFLEMLRRREAEAEQTGVGRRHVADTDSAGLQRGQQYCSSDPRGQKKPRRPTGERSQALANANGPMRDRSLPDGDPSGRARFADGGANVPDAHDRGGTLRRDGELPATEVTGEVWPNFGGGTPEYGGGEWWPAEPDVGRAAHGIPSRVDRLKCLGNAVVPAQFYPIFRAIYHISFRDGE